MIARIWHGWTSHENASLYQQLLVDEIMPGIAARNMVGYCGYHLLRRSVGNEVEFTTMMWFESLEQVKQFMGEDYEVAHIPEKAAKLLSRWDQRSQHCEAIMFPNELSNQ